jgi:hypothetical protein
MLRKKPNRESQYVFRNTRFLSPDRARTSKYSNGKYPSKQDFFFEGGYEDKLKAFPSVSYLRTFAERGSTKNTSIIVFLHIRLFH